MREIIYKCDMCGKEYKYSLAATDNDRSILLRFNKYDLCRQCVKQVEEYICLQRQSTI